MIKRKRTPVAITPAPTLIGPGGIARLALLGASFVVIIAGMKASASLLVPFLLAMFIAVVMAPLVLWLNRIGLPYILALLAVILLLIIAAVGMVSVVGQSLAQFISNVPEYQLRLQAQVDLLDDQLEAWGIERFDDSVEQAANPQTLINYLASGATIARDLLGNTMLIMLVAIFMLLELTTLPARIASLPGEHAPAWAQARIAIDKVRRYMAMKTLTSAATGSLVAAMLAMLGISQSITLGLLAFMLNFVPNIGSFIAAIPALLLAFIEYGLTRTIYCAAGYVVINVTIGSFIEPRVMGRSLGLSALVVILSLIFWGWVLGPVGMLLSVPLTIVVRLILEVSDETRWLALLMSGTIAPVAPTTEPSSPEPAD